MNDGLLSLHRAARRIGVTARWLRIEADAGRVPCLRADNRLLFDVETLAHVLRSRVANAPLAGEGEVSQ